MKLTLLLIFIFSGTLAYKNVKNLKILYEWSQIEFDYPSEEARQKDIDSGNFREGQVQPFDVQVYYKNKTQITFITTARYAEGIPATLGIVTDKKRKGNNIVKPYPSWDWQTEPRKCKKQRIVSVYRIFVDECDRMWIIDTGKIEPHTVCPPQILIFDLKTDTLLHTYEIPESQHKNKSIYVTPIVEVEDRSDGCKNTYLYGADCNAFSLIIYDLKNDRSWTIHDESFRPEANFSVYHIAGEVFNVSDGILGMALSPPKAQRKLYYHAMSSETENWVYTKHLKNESQFTRNSSRLFHEFPHGRGTQSGAEAIDKSGTMYFGLYEDIQIVSWDTNSKQYDRKEFKIIGDDQNALQFPSGVKVTDDENGEEILWVFSTSYQKVAAKHLYSNETNFRILYGKISDFN